MTDEYMENLIAENIEGYGYITNITTYELAYVNDALLEKHNLINDDYSGKKCYEFLHGLDKPCDFCCKDELVYKDVHKWHKTENNSYYLIKDTTFEENNTTYLIQTAQDISKEILEINELKEKIHIDDAIIECAKTLVYEDDFNVSITKLLGVICSFGNADYTFVYERNYYAGTSTLAYTYFRKNCDFDIQKFDVLAINSSSSPLEIMLQEKPCIFIDQGSKDIEKLGYANTILGLENVDNILLVPLKMEKLIVGVIGVINVRYNSPDYSLMNNVATFVVNKLNTKYSRDKLKKSVYNFQSKMNLNNLIINSAKTLIDSNSENDVDISVNRLLKIVCDFFFGKGAYIFNHEAGTNSLLCRFEYLNGGFSTSANWHNLSFKVINEWYKLHQKNGTMYIKSVINELQDNSAEYKLLCDEQITSFILTPLYRNNKISGFLWIDNPKKSFEDISVIKSISTLVVSHVSRDELIKQLGNLSFSDNLTGLYNRNFYLKYVKQLQLQPRKNMGVIFADINGLKKANDNLGHEYGDDLVRWCGGFLNKHVRGFVFRIGGDEFVSFVENIDELSFNTLLNDIKNELNKHKNVHISIGSQWTEYADDVDDLVKQADDIMYKDKEDYYAEKRKQNLSLEDELNLLKEFILEFKQN